jgi:hypothetical protein
VTIARQSGDIGDERVARFRQAVEQRRFADVGATDDGNRWQHRAAIST